MNLINSETEVKVHVPVEGRRIATIVDSVDYIEEDNDVKVSYHFDEDFYLTDDVEFLNSSRLRKFEVNLQQLVATKLNDLIRRQEFMNAARA